MTRSWPDVARATWAEYQQLLAGARVPEIAAAARERKLAGMVPHLLDEISKRDVLLTAVRRLTATGDGLYDRKSEETVTVAQLREALGEEVRGG